MISLYLMAALFVTSSDIQIKQQEFMFRLYRQNHYFQSIAEARRYGLLYNEDMDYFIALCYFKGGELTAAQKILEQKSHKEPQHYLLLSTIYTHLYRYDNALQALSMFDSGASPPLQLAYYKNLLAVYVHQFQWDAALQVYSEHSSELEAMRSMFDILNEARKPSVNPYAAAVFSALIPGAGQFYAHRYSDGIISFLTVAVLASAAYLSHTKGNTALMYTFGTLTAMGYAGSVYSAYNAAVNRRHAINSNYRTRLLNNYLHFDPEMFLPHAGRQ